MQSEVAANTLLRKSEIVVIGPTSPTSIPKPLEIIKTNEFVSKMNVVSNSNVRASRRRECLFALAKSGGSEIECSVHCGDEDRE